MFRQYRDIYAYTSIIKAFGRFSCRKNVTIIINIYANVLDNCLSMNYDELEKWSYSVFCIRYIKGKRGTHPWQKQKDHS